MYGKGFREKQAQDMMGRLAAASRAAYSPKDILSQTARETLWMAPHSGIENDFIEVSFGLT